MIRTVVIALVACSATLPLAGQAADTASALDGRLEMSLTLAVPTTADAAADIEPAAPAIDADPLPVVDIAVAPQLPRTIDLTARPDDLLVRMRRGFSMPNLQNDLVTRHQNGYLARPEQLRRMVERARPYLHYILGEIEKRGLPSELALLPMVESAFNPMAYSRSHAAGLWQFIPGTGRAYDLEQNWWVDERRDILAATGAALDYLSAIYQMHGDWQLALASYNWGENAVGRALEKNRARDLPLDYSSLKMPAETRNYVPKLQALKNIFASPELLAQLDIPAVPNEPFFEVVEKPADIDVSLAARLAGMRLDDFVALNPAHRRPVIKADLPIILPTDRVDLFRSNLAAHEAPLTSWTSHTLARGERLESVAKRYGISLAALKANNDLNQRRPRVRAGMTLLVPNRRLAAEQPVASNASASTQAARYTVRRGDTLFSIARRHGVDVAKLERLNGVHARQIRPGMRLRLAEAEAPGARGSKTRHYIVKRGDTAHAIARQFRVDVADLLRDNALTTSRLKPGQALTIVLADSRTTAN